MEGNERCAFCCRLVYNNICNSRNNTCKEENLGFMVYYSNLLFFRAAVCREISCRFLKKIYIYNV